MGNISGFAPGQGVIVDIDSELAYWRTVLPASEFRHLPVAFEDLVPTIKFGYDCFLLFHHQTLAEVLPGLRDRYVKQVPYELQLDWRWADQITRHAWGRLRAS